ncbi:unnamed protein product [Caretta caretta]
MAQAPRSPSAEEPRGRPARGPRHLSPHGSLIRSEPWPAGIRLHPPRLRVRALLLAQHGPGLRGMLWSS